MIVAARAGDGHAQNSAGDGIDALIPIVGHEAVDHFVGEALIFVIDGRGAQIAEGAKIVARDAGHFIGGELET